MARVALALAAVAAVLGAVLLTGDDQRVAAPARAAAALPAQPCSAAWVPNERTFQGDWHRRAVTVGPVVFLSARPAERATASAAVPLKLRTLIAPGVAVRLRVDGPATLSGGARERRFAACPPVPADQRAERILGHRGVGVELLLDRDGPACVRLTVAVGGGVTASRTLGLGRRCAARPAGDAFAGCDARVEPVFNGGPAFRLGPVGILGLGPAGRHRSVKFPVMVSAGAVVTLRFGGGATVQAGGTRQPARAVTYVGCPADEPLFSEPRGTVGPRTAFAGALTAPRSGCVPVEARLAVGPPLRARLPVGVERC